MTLVRVDGFDHYADLTQRWSVGSFVPVIGSFGRGGNGVQLSGNSGMTLALPAAQPITYWGAAIRIHAGTAPILAQMFDGGTLQFYLFAYADGTLGFFRGGVGTPLALSTVKIKINRYTYVEALMQVANSATCEVRLDGQTVLTASGIDTQNSVNASATSIAFGPSVGTIGGFGIMDWDDLYVTDGTSGYLGDLRIEPLFPVGPGASSGLTAVNNAPNWRCVAEQGQPNDETDYVEGSGATDTYEYGELVESAATVHAVAVDLRARQSTAGPNTIAAKAGGSSGPALTMLDTWKSFQSIFEGGWTVGNVNSSEYGVAA